jgi:PPM family protein phosphatase
MSEDAAVPVTARERPRPLTLRVVQKSDVGLVRTENQDFAILSSPEDVNTADRGRLMIVADGMGGHRGGATASRMAATIIKEQYLNGDFPDPGEALRVALQMANQQIYLEAQNNPELRGMGTTCSALAIRGEEAWFAHVGDSRIYLVREDQIRQLTQDHSLVASMVREGLITSEEAEVHPRRNVLQRSMGVVPEVEIDVSAPFRVQPGDIFILCSDGLHGVVRELEMKEVVKLPLETVATEFVRRSIERGAPDNVTVIVARVEEESSDSAGEAIPVPATVEAPLDSTLPNGEVPMLETPPSISPAAAMSPAAPVSTAAAELLGGDLQPAVPVNETLSDAEAASGPAPAPARSGRSFWIVLVLLLVLAAGAATIAYVVSRPSPAPPQSTPATR